MESLLFAQLKLEQSIDCTINDHSQEDLTALRNDLAAKKTLKEKWISLRQHHP